MTRDSAEPVFVVYESADILDGWVAIMSTKDEREAYSRATSGQRADGSCSWRRLARIPPRVYGVRST